MLSKKELLIILASLFVFAFLISITTITWKNFGLGFLTALVILLSNLIAKKFVAYMLDTKIEIDFWHVYHYGFHSRSHFPRPVPFGFVLPLLLAFITLGYIKPLSFLQFEAKPMKARASRRYGFHSYRSFSVDEFHIALIAFAGFMANILLALATRTASPLIARYSIYYVLWNIWPISRLDGGRLFFGSVFFWAFTLFLTILVLGIVI